MTAIDILGYIFIAILAVILLYLCLKFSLTKYYRRVYRKHGIYGLSHKYGWFSSIFTKPEEILGMINKGQQLENNPNLLKNFNYLNQYASELDPRELYKEEANILGLKEPIGPNTEKIYLERFGKFNFNFTFDKGNGYWVNYIMMQQQAGKSINNKSR